ncbi:MAG: ABC transporter ATP-binding protein [Candidatus Kapabacteria bacterium]|jgi:lipoprotein-releasing system ATP-binding protein|nr:ABC transporter ATP-binding protein [Candidatus Kapabacteria bacterium]
MEKSILIEVKSLSKSYKKKNIITPVINNFSLKVRRSEFLALQGPSGIGKSTLLHLLASLDYPDLGTVEYYFDDKPVNIHNLNSDRISKIRNEKIGFIFQFHHLLPEFTALENIMMPALIAGKSKKIAVESAKQLAEEVGIQHRNSHRPSELSGGEQQRVAIARALINNPIVVLADEPTGNLDAKNEDGVLELMKRMQEKYSPAFVVATHSNKVSGVAERIVSLD